MLSVRQEARLLHIIRLCHDQIKRRGAHTEIAINIPGTWRKTNMRRLSSKGPHGEIIFETHNGKELFVLFKAAPLLTSLEEIVNAHTTG